MGLHNQTFTQELHIGLATMADLDAELLALAGGDDSSAEDGSPPPPNNKSSSPVQSPRQSPSSSAMGFKGTARTVKKTKTRRLVRKQDSDDEA